MARRKSVPISPKPTHSAADSVENSVTANPEAAGEIETSESTGAIGRAVYGTVYCLSYGIMFSVTLLGNCIPGSALIGRAWRDGCKAGACQAEKITWKPEISEGDPTGACG